MSNWISVKDILPEDSQYVLIYFSEDIRFTFFSDGYFYQPYTVYSNRFNFNSISHWMPLPEPPKD